MVKPQFEVGRGRVGKGGVVHEPALRREAVASVAGTARASGASVLGFAPSGLPGPAGNRETFVWLGEGGRGSVSDDALAEVERVKAASVLTHRRVAETATAMRELIAAARRAGVVLRFPPEEAEKHGLDAGRRASSSTPTGSTTSTSAS